MRQLAMLLAAAYVVVGPATVDATQPLTLQVSPTISPAPGVISVRATVEPSDDNLSLQIVAQSAEFIRSSSVDIDGSHTPRLNVFEYRNLPSGVYDVSAILVGTRGTRAMATRTIEVVRTPGAR